MTFHAASHSTFLLLIFIHVWGITPNPKTNYYLSCPISNFPASYCSVYYMYVHGHEIAHNIGGGAGGGGS